MAKGNPTENEVNPVFEEIFQCTHITIGCDTGSRFKENLTIILSTSLFGDTSDIW